MSYVIAWDGCSELWVMGSEASRTIGDLLIKIAKENSIKHAAISESHLLSILIANGVDVVVDDYEG